MKPYFLRINFIFIIALFLIATFSAYAQNSLAGILFSNWNCKYVGQLSDNRKERNGIGILNEGAKGIYLGSFNRNKYSGKGMLISERPLKIEGVEDCYIYIGGWLKGKMSGNGICYALNGDILYKGKFLDDIPIGEDCSYDDDIYFSIVENDNTLFIGELKNGMPYGYGLEIQEDGIYWIGNWKDGERQGLGLFIYNPTDWELVTYKDDAVKTISSSGMAEARHNNNKEANKRIWETLLNDLSDVALGLGEVAISALPGKSSNSPQSSGYTLNNVSTDFGGSHHENVRSSANNNNNSKCGSAWIIESRAYSNYESQLIKGGLLESDIDQIKNKMRQIRTKWEKRGCPIAKSQVE